VVSYDELTSDSIREFGPSQNVYLFMPGLWKSYRFSL
jgi:hypothetical protein